MERALGGWAATSICFESYCLAASASMVNLMSSPMAADAGDFWPKSKALRLREPVAERPVIILPLRPGCGAVGPSTSRVMDLVTPASVRSPVTLRPFGATGDGGGFEGDGGVLLDVEEVGALEVGVAAGGVGVDGVGVEGDIDAALRDVFVVPDEGADDAGDAAANVANAHVTDLEVGVGVSGVEHPGGGLGEGGGRR